MKDKDTIIIKEAYHVPDLAYFFFRMFLSLSSIVFPVLLHHYPLDLSVRFIYDLLPSFLPLLQ
uniref:Uncharacterized protein n=1 Tax=Megaselia scalaris TaxID=36166 RepID=T1GR35_MEGSC